MSASANGGGPDPLLIDAVAFVLLLLVLPLASLGTTSGTAALWWLGLALLVVGALTTLGTEFALEGGR